ncbi:hypothetical protein [Paenibacillus harenae]|uniref:hypothetical protein n=1 Tax=Paenibacillus harenae TaxID=306543 RepID=UPI0027D89AD0|nr:hypothetical protein [Paenibacillus harenae]
MFLNPTVAKTIVYENEGKPGLLTLLKGDDNKEFIALIIDKRFAFGYISTSEDNSIFEDLRSRFDNI